MIDNNFGPLRLLPGTPWFGVAGVGRGAGTPVLPTNFAVSQKVIIKSNFAANPGVLASGRRPDRPGR